MSVAHIFYSVLLLVTSIFSAGSASDLESTTNDNILLSISEQENLVEDVASKNVTEAEKNTTKPFLLSNGVRPLHYRLEIIPLLFDIEDVSSEYFGVSKFTAPGKVWIQLKCTDTTSNVTLHAHKDVTIDISKIKIFNVENERDILINNVTRDNDTDFVTLSLSETIGGSEGSLYSIYIEFLSRIADDRLNGLYLDYYINPGTNEKRYLSTTLFAPNHARKAFPCFDEPGFKANFSVSIGRKSDAGYASISNMPRATTEPIQGLQGWVWDIFEESIPLPTYLVAMITTDFAFRRVKHDKVEVKLHAPEFLLERTKKLNSANSNFLDKLQNPYVLQDPLLFVECALKMWEKTGLGQYPISKLDIVALPHFFFSAMENLGAMTFKYPVILNIENVTTSRELLKLSQVAGHEVVHQWFGNLLTPKTWTYVWLKESFSDLFSQIFVAKKLYHHYNHEVFVNNELQRALRFDGGPDTHALENHIKSVSDVGEIYTDIPYRKGASIMNMARLFLGNYHFQHGLDTLFQEKKYSNIDQYDLFRHLEQSQQTDKILESQGLSSNITVADVLNPWTKHNGYPVVRVCREGSSHRIVLKQEQFQNGLLKDLNIRNESNMDSNDLRLTEAENKFWWIPVHMFKVEEESRPYHIKWLPPNNDNTTIETPEELYSITNVAGYFRILYSRKELNSILRDFAQIYYSGSGSAYAEYHYKRLNPAERSQLLDDYFAFTFAKYEDVPVKLLFHIMSHLLPFEGEAVVWNTFFNNLESPFQLLQGTKYYPSFQKYLKHLLRPLFSYLSSQEHMVLRAPCHNSSALAKRMKFNGFKSLVFAWLCQVDGSECNDAAGKSVMKFMATGLISTIPADNQLSMYCAAVKHASGENLNAIWSFFERKYFEEYYSVQRDRYLKALSCTSKVDYLRRLLSWTTNVALDFHDVDRVTLLKNVVDNPEGRRIILNFLDENFDQLYKSESAANPVTETLKALVKYINSNQLLETMERFLAKHSSVMEKKKKFLEKQERNAKLNILWMNTFAKDIQQSCDYHLENTFTDNKQTCSEESVHDFKTYIDAIAE